LLKKEDALVLESKFAGSVGFDPLLRPYYWLLQGPGESRTLDRLRNIEVWVERLSGATIKSDRETVNGSVSIVMDVPPEPLSRPWFYRVYLAPEYGYYPLRYERIMRDSGEVTSRCDVTSAHPFDVDGRVGVFPLVIAYDEKGLDGHSFVRRVEMVVEPVHLKINGSIDDEVFTVSPRRARHVVDVAQANQSVKEAIAMRERQVRGGGQDSHWIVRLSVGLAATLVVAVVAIGYAMWRRHIA
jgi:hypothetical protein